MQYRTRLVREALRKKLVWGKGRIVPGWDSLEWRRDDFGNVICWSEYGLSTEYGWEIDHITAVALGGSDRLFNLRPLHHSVNSALGGVLGGALGATKRGRRRR